MARTLSNMLPLGTKAPEFELTDVVSGNRMALSRIKSEKATVVMFICNHCPYVLHVLDEILRLAGEYQQRGVSFIAISSNDVVNYPADSPEKMKEMANQRAFPFPYLYDESQEVARSYQAACTPDFFVFDENLACVYRGRLDESTPGNDRPVTGKDLRNALDAALKGKPVEEEQFPSMGCNIKWRK